MKVYIFGSNKEKFTCKAKNAAYVGDNMDEALEKFQEIIDCIKFYNCYLVVDFEAGNGRKLFRSVSLDDDTEETLSARVLEQEHIIYPKVIELYLAGKIHVNGRHVTIDD